MQTGGLQLTAPRVVKVFYIFFVFKLNIIYLVPIALLSLGQDDAELNVH